VASRAAGAADGERADGEKQKLALHGSSKKGD
jgi:hypothetical protein